MADKLFPLGDGLSFKRLKDMGDGTFAEVVSVNSPLKKSAGVSMIDWDSVAIGSPTAGWTVTKDTSKKFGGKTTLKVTATAGAADTLVCSLTVPSTFLGGAKRIAFAVANGDSYITGDGTNPVQLWINLSGSTTHRITSYAYPSAAPGDWAEGILFDQDASASGHITGTAQWAKLAAEAFTTITLVMSKRAGTAIVNPVNISPVYTDPYTLPILTIFMDGQYSGQYNYARQILQAYGFKASMAILPYWFNDYPTAGAGAFPGTMTIAQAKAMYALGHEWIDHSGIAGPAGHVDVGWNDTSKYPDGQEYSILFAEKKLVRDFLIANNATDGLGLGVVGFTNGLVNTQTLLRRTNISNALRDAGLFSIRQLAAYVASYYGCATEAGLVVTPTQIVTSADTISTATAVVDKLMVRGGWSGLTFHDIVLSGETGNNVSVATFKGVMDYIATQEAAGKLRVMRMSNAMRELSVIGKPG